MGDLIALGAALLGLFVRLERRVANPILRLDLFRHGDFSGATLAAFASGAGVLALMSMVPTSLERGPGLTPLSAVLVLLAWSGLTVLSALGVQFLPVGLSARSRVVLALLGCAAGQALMLLTGQGMGWPVVLPGLLVAGLANGLLNASLGHAAVQSVPSDLSAVGSAANNTARHLGSVLGLALVSVLLAAAERETLFVRWHEAVFTTSAFSVFGETAPPAPQPRLVNGALCGDVHYRKPARLRSFDALALDLSREIPALAPLHRKLLVLDRKPTRGVHSTEAESRSESASAAPTSSQWVPTLEPSGGSACATPRPSLRAPAATTWARLGRRPRRAVEPAGRGTH